MKVLVTLLAVLSVGYAMTSDKEIIIPVPEGVDRSNPRFLEDIVSSIVEDVSEQIRETGLDPFTFDGLKENIGLPVPILFDAALNIENVRVTGLSDIVINSINFNLLALRLTLDVSLPRIEVSVDGAGFDLTLLGEHLTGEANNIRIGVIEAGISGLVQVNIGIISGISIRDLDLNFNLGGVTFNGNVILLGNDLSSSITWFATVWIPDTLHKLRYDVNELVEIIAWELLDEIL